MGFEIYTYTSVIRIASLGGRAVGLSLSATGLVAVTSSGGRGLTADNTGLSDGDTARRAGDGASEGRGDDFTASSDGSNDATSTTVRVGSSGGASGVGVVTIAAAESGG